MKKVIQLDGLPIKMWLNNIEDSALNQAYNLARLPFVYKWPALMPDAHKGYGMLIGGVIACDNVIIPNAVGNDINCGVIFINTNIDLSSITLDNLKSIISNIRKLVPVGNKRHKESSAVVLDKYMPIIIKYDISKHICDNYYNSVLQLGTLGSGNHFIELQKNTDNKLCIMVHSGSRNLGYRICNYHNNIAKALNAKYFSSIPAKYDLAFLPVDSPEGYDYIEDMNYCVDYAKANRSLILSNVLLAISDTLDIELKVKVEDAIDVAHNYAKLENHYGKNLWVHRKGATAAFKDQIGLIPGSQGSSSFIVKGLGNPLSFCSCSHGAGRSMSRNDAKKSLNFEEEVKKLNDQGIIHTIRTREDLDESTGSYKDIYKVMENQSDLIDIVEELKPIACVKG